MARGVKQLFTFNSADDVLYHYLPLRHTLRVPTCNNLKARSKYTIPAFFHRLTFD